MQSYAVKLLITKPKGPSYRIESISDLIAKFGDNTDPAFALRCELVKKYEKDYSSYHRNERLPSNMCVSCQSTSFLSCQRHNHPYCLYCYQSSKNAVASNSKYMSLPVMDNCPCDSRTTVHRQKSMFCSMFQLFPSREIVSDSHAPVSLIAHLCWCHHYVITINWCCAVCACVRARVEFVCQFCHFVEWLHIMWWISAVHLENVEIRIQEPHSTTTRNPRSQHKTYLRDGSSPYLAHMLVYMRLVLHCTWRNTCTCISPLQVFPI